MLDKLKAFWAKFKAFLVSLQPIFSKIGSFLSTVFAGLKTVIEFIWSNSKTFIIIAVGIIGTLEFNKIKEYFIVKGSQDEINSDDKKDQNLVNDEKTDEQKAQDLENQANNLPNNEPPVDPDWFEKK